MQTHPFLNKLLNGGEVNWFPVEEIFLLREGKHPNQASKEVGTGHELPLFGLNDLLSSNSVLPQATQHAQVGKHDDGVFPANSIIVSQIAGVHALITVDHVCTSRLTNCTIKNEYADVFDIRFAYHYFYLILAQTKVRANNLRAYHTERTDINKLLIPIPCPDKPERSLDVQEKLTRVLDTFTELNDEVRKQLIMQRKQQDYYRYQLLNFPRSRLP